MYGDFSPYTSIILLCGQDNLKSFACILPKFVMHVTNDQFSDKFDNCSKIADLLQFFTFYVVYW